MNFRPLDYGEEVARILELDGAGTRLMPLAPNACSSERARTMLKGVEARELFPESFAPEAALSGLYLYFSCLDEAHGIAQNIETQEGSFWHGIMHRQEPDAANAGYWFRKVGRHAIYPELRTEAHRLRFDTGPEWDPFEFIEFCESSRERPGSDEEGIALRIQSAEWRLLFDFCARKREGASV